MCTLSQAPLYRHCTTHWRGLPTWSILLAGGLAYKASNVCMMTAISSKYTNFFGYSVYMLDMKRHIYA